MKRITPYLAAATLGLAFIATHPAAAQVLGFGIDAGYPTYPAYYSRVTDIRTVMLPIRTVMLPIRIIVPTAILTLITPGIGALRLRELPRWRLRQLSSQARP